MIKRRTVILLGAVTLATAAGAVAAVVDRTAETRTEVEAVRLYPKLDDQAGEVQQVQVARAADSPDGTVTLLRTDGGWVLKERDHYPARTDLVRKLLFDLGQLELIERKTADPTRFDRLELADVGAKGAKASRVVVTTAGGDEVVDLHVGKRRESPTGGKPRVYVRRSDERQTYLAEGELDLRGSPVEWLLREIVNVPKDSIAEATITAPSGEVLHLSRVGKDFRIDDMPAGRKVASQYSVNNAATVLDKLLFDDVRSAAGLTFSADQGRAVFKTGDGLTVTLEFAADPKAAGPGAPEPEAPEPGAGPWIRVAIAVAADAGDDARKLAEAASRQTEGWAYRVSSYDLERLRATAESLTKPAEGS